MIPARSTWGPIGALLVLLAAVAGIGAAGRAVPLDAWAVRIGEGGAPAVAGLIVAGTLATAVGFPRQLVATLAGYAFGVAGGVALALAAATAGCAVTMLVARRWLAAPVRGRWPDAVTRLGDLLGDDLFVKIVALRLQPLGTNLLTNLCAGVLRMPAPTFLTASCLGYVPQTLVFALAGGGVRSGSNRELLTSAGLFVVSLALGAWLLRRHRARIAKTTGGMPPD